MYKRLEILLLEGLSGASRAVLHHARKENYHTKQNWNTAIDSLDSNAQQYEKDRDRDKSLNHFKKAEEHSQQVSKLLPTVPQTHRAKKRRAFAVLRQAKEEGRSKEQSMKAFDRVYAGKAGLRLGRLVDEALSGASKAYKNHTRNWYKHFEKPSSPEVKSKAAKTWGALKKAKSVVPQSDARKEARRKPEYQTHYMQKMVKRSLKAQEKRMNEMTDVNDPHSRKCKMCGSVAHRQHSGYKKGFRKYACSSGTKCNFNWMERDKAKEPKTPKEQKRDVNKLGDWADRHHIK